MDRPYLPSEVSCNLGRDWPDARGIWQNSDRTLGAFLNRKDHIILSLVEPGSNFKASFSKFYKFVKQVSIFFFSKYSCKNALKRFDFFWNKSLNISSRRRLGHRNGR